MTLTIPMESARAEDRDSVLAFQRMEESHEHAFSYLLPFGWISHGGVVRRDPLAPSVNPMYAAPQMDFTLERDSVGSAMIRWMPNIVYYDTRRARISGSQLFPPGSTYQGMLVYPKMNAAKYVMDLALRVAHPTAVNIRILDRQSLGKLSRAHNRLVRGGPEKLTYSYDAATLLLTYDEGGVTYKERWLAVIEDRGEMGGGQWGNKETVFYRAPVAEFDGLVSVFEVAFASISGNPDWAATEMQTDSAQADVALQTRRNLDDPSHRMTMHQRQISDLVHSALFSAPGEHLRYLNPFTGAPERGASAWRYRWVNPMSDVLFSNDSSYVPDVDVRFAGRQFKRCESSPDSVHTSRPVPASLQSK
ncbi:MAG TPA: hypothetical protein VGL38_15110 [bacterium]